jgi:hypothetical protein
MEKGDISVRRTERQSSRKSGSRECAKKGNEGENQREENYVLEGRCANLFKRYLPNN